MEKLKKIVKYTANIMYMLNGLLVVIDPIWNIPYADKISSTLVAVSAVLASYLVGTKIFNRIEKRL